MPEIQVEALDGLQTLLDGTAKVAGVEPYMLDSRALAVLGRVNWDHVPGESRSGLNYDDSPLQLVLTAGAERAGLRLLGDPNSWIADPAERYRASLNAMERVGEIAGCKSLTALFRRTLDINLPRDPSELYQYPDGVMWLGALLGTPGCAMYVDARRGGTQTALARLGEWLREICGDTSDVATLLSALSTRTRLMCLGIEGSSYANARAKVYWRMERPAELKSLGIPGFEERSFSEFLSLLMTKRRIRLSGVVLNAGIHVATGEWADVKLDVCGCRNCLDFSSEEAASVIAQLTSHFNLAPLPASAVLNYAEFAFCGLGLDVRGQYRLNVYVKAAPPRGESSGSERARAKVV